MRPVLFTLENLPVLGNYSVTSFGLFLVLAILISFYIIWRLIRIYELNEEHIADLFILTMGGGFIFSRIYFIVSNPQQLDYLTKFFQINKYPGLPFWGALLGGFLTLKFFTKRYKLNFWQIADFAIVGLFFGIFLGSIGCLLGSCQYGLESSSPLAITQQGVIGKRFPLQIIEGSVFLIGFFYLWRQILKFHSAGQIAIRGLFIFSLTKLILEFFRGDSQIIFNLRLGAVFSALIFFLTTWLFYAKASANIRGLKRTPVSDLQFLLSLLTQGQRRKSLYINLKKSWYNLLVDVRINSLRLKRGTFKLLNIKSNPTSFKE